MKSVALFSASSLLCMALSLGTYAQENTITDVSMKKSTKAAAAKVVDDTKTSKFTGRLPRFFAKVVDSRQRTAIYDIQRSYYEKKQELIQQLDELKRLETGKIDEVLTASQRKQLEEMRATSSSKLSQKLTTSKLPQAEPAAATPMKSATKKSVDDEGTRGKASSSQAFSKKK